MKSSVGVRRVFVEDREGIAVPRVLPLLVIAAALFGLGVVWNAVAPACVAGITALLTIVAARENRFLLGAGLLAFGVRALLSVALYAIATVDLPALRALQVGPVAGYWFWIFAPDPSGYHGNAVWVDSAWQHGTEFPTAPGTVGAEYFIIIAGVYRLLGVNPLNAVFWNALFGALATVTGYRIAARLGGPSAARPAALLIALWPSAVLWSSQLMKDSVCLLVTLVLLYLTMRVVDPVPAVARWRAFARWVGLLLLLFVAAAVMHRFRHYIVQLMVPFTAVFVVHALVRRTRQTPWRIFAACTVITVMFLGVSADRRVDLDRMVVPRNPEIGHINLGIMYQSRGDLDTAAAHYERALALAKEKDYPPALKMLGTVAIARNDRSMAIAYLERYLAREPADQQARAALDALRPPVAGARVQGKVAALVPTPLPVPPKPFALTGPKSDYTTGGRGWYGDIVGALNQTRTGYTATGGDSLIDREVVFRDYWDVLRYLPRAVGHVLLSPYPWQWFDVGGGTGPFKALSAVEALLLYALVIPLFVGLGAAVRRGSPDALYLTGFVLAAVAMFGLAISNLGTLFRVRLEALVPLLTVVGVGCAALFRRREPGVTPGAPIRVARVIARLNIGGPAQHVVYLTARLPRDRFESVLLSGREAPSEGSMHDLAARSAVRPIAVPGLGRRLSPVDDLRSLVFLVRFFRRFRPHVVHTHTAKAGAIGRLAAWLAGVPVVVHTYHGHVFHGYFSRPMTALFLAVERSLARSTSRLLTVSESVKRELERYRVGAPGQITVLPLGLDLDRFLGCEARTGELRRELGVDDRALLVGIVARLVPIKRHEDFIAASALVAKRIPATRFLVVGDGERRAELEALVRGRDLAGRLSFLGWRQDLERIYADLDVVVLTSANEGSPVSLIEAMAAARPVVSTAVGGVPDLIEHGVSGVLVPAGDPSATAETIVELLADPERRHALGDAGRKRVRDAYSIDRLVSDMDRLYSELVRGPGLVTLA